MARLAPVHEMLRRVDAAPEAVSPFRALSPTSHAWSRLHAHVFSPEEVVSRVLQQVRLAAADVEAHG
jgi:hypothetical protein